MYSLTFKNLIKSTVTFFPSNYSALFTLISPLASASRIIGMACSQSGGCFLIEQWRQEVIKDDKELDRSEGTLTSLENSQQCNN